jgi:hypothetical protein
MSSSSVAAPAVVDKHAELLKMVNKCTHYKCTLAQSTQIHVKRRKRFFLTFFAFCPRHAVVRTFCMHCFMALIDASPKTVDCRLGVLCGCGARYCGVKCLVADAQAHKALCADIQSALQALAKSRFRATEKTNQVALVRRTVAGSRSLFAAASRRSGQARRGTSASTPCVFVERRINWRRFFQNHVAGQLRSVSRARTVQILCRLVGECDKIDITAASTPARIGAKLVYVERVGLVGGEPVLATKHVRRMNLTQVLTESGSAVPLTHADVPGERMQLLLAVGKRALQEWKRQSKAAGAGER